MAAEIAKAFPAADVELVDGGRGDFIVKRDGRLLWDKRNDQGRFPDEPEILDALRD